MCKNKNTEEEYHGYCVTFFVSGTYAAEVEASNEDDALHKAEEAYQAADFGSLYNIAADPPHATPGNLHWFVEYPVTGLWQGKVYATSQGQANYSAQAIFDCEDFGKLYDIEYGMAEINEVP